MIFTLFAAKLKQKWAKKNKKKSFGHKSWTISQET